jgi:hypothetical protein
MVIKVDGKTIETTPHIEKVISLIFSLLGFLEARNAGVHDYFGLSSEEYAGIARNFYTAAVD